MSQTETCFTALVAALTLPAGDTRLPAPSVEDARLQDYDSAGRLLAIRKADTLIIDEELGSGAVEYDLQLEAEVIFAVQGDDNDARAALVSVGETAFHDRLFADRTLGGAVDELSLQGEIERQIVRDERTTQPIQTVRFVVTLLFTASSPFG